MLMDISWDNSLNNELLMLVMRYNKFVYTRYLNMEEKTKEALDEEGWLHSGDIGKKDKDGFLFITGRYIFLGFVAYNS